MKKVVIVLLIATVGLCASVVGFCDSAITDLDVEQEEKVWTISTDQNLSTVNNNTVLESISRDRNRTYIVKLRLSL